MAITIESIIEQDGYYNQNTYYGVEASTSTGGISYTWERSDNGGFSWSTLLPNLNSSLLGIGTDQIQLSYAYVSSNVRRIYRVLVSDTESSEYSSIFGSYSQPTISILSGNSSFVNNVFTLSIQAESVIDGDAFVIPRYSWQSSINDGVTWTDVPSNLNDGILYAPVEPIRNRIVVTLPTTIKSNIKMRAVVVATGADAVFSNSFDITYSPIGTQQPTISIIFKGSSLDAFANEVYSVIGNSSDGSEVVYQWQYSEDNANWQNLNDSDAYVSGSTTSNLRLSPLYLEQSYERFYRCVLSSLSANSIFSETFGSTNPGLRINFVYSGGLNNPNPAESIGGPPSQNSLSGTLNNLFPDVSKENSEEGVVDYRCFYMTNDSVTGDSLYKTSAYIQAELNNQSTVDLGISKENDVQILSLATNPTSGYFRLRIGSVTTPEIYWNSDYSIFESNIQNSLNYLNSVQVLVSRTLLSNYQISFVGNSGYRNFELLEVVENNFSPPTVIQIEKQIEGQPINSVAPRIFNSQSPPFNVTFFETNFNNKLLIGDLHPGDVVPIWIRRYTYGPISSDQLNGFNLRITGNKNASNLEIPNINSSSTTKPDFYYG